MRRGISRCRLDLLSECAPCPEAASKIDLAPTTLYSLVRKQMGCKSSGDEERSSFLLLQQGLPSGHVDEVGGGISLRINGRLFLRALIAAFMLLSIGAVFSPVSFAAGTGAATTATSHAACPQLPSNFDPLHASREELASLHLSPRPTDPAQLAGWLQRMRKISASCARAVSSTRTYR